MKSYKLFRLLKDGSITPLFINKTQRLEEDIWYEAEFHPTKGFSSSRGGGWHCCTQPVAPHLNMTLKTGEKRIWVEVDVEDYKKYDRPESQGSAWILAQRMKIIKRRPDIKDTKGGYGG